MNFLLEALVLCIVVNAVFAQEPAPEPEYVNQAYLLKDGKLQKLEITAFTMQHKTTNHIVTVKGTLTEVVEGTQSPVRVPPDAHFIIRLENSDIDPSTLIKLQLFKVGKGDREYLLHTAKAHPFGGVSSKSPDDNSVPITIQKYGVKSVEVTPIAPLPPGEYFFRAGMQADCFGVDAK